MVSRTLLFLSLLAALSACDRQSNNPPAGAGTSAPPTAYPTQESSSGTGASSSSTGTPNAAEQKRGSNPVQGQVDPKQPDQHRDFQQKGDGAGPKSPETTPPGPKR